MKYRKLGESGPEVSEICLGTWVFGGDHWGDVDDKTSESVVTTAIDLGINFIDTAPIYGSGRAESVVGRAIKGKRNKVIIATKCGLKPAGNDIEIDLSARFIRQDAENSLNRLGIETIDLYQCHWPDNKTPFDETFGELKKLVKEGKVRYLGVSNFDRKQTIAAMERAEITTSQMQYSILDRRIEKDLMPLLKEEKIGLLPYGALGGGILTGKYRTPPEIKPGDVKDFFYRYYKEPEWSKAMSIVSLMDEIAAKYDSTVSNVAINWTLARSETASCIVGSRTPSQIEENIKAVKWTLSENDTAKLDELS